MCDNRGGYRIFQGGGGGGGRWGGGGLDPRYEKPGGGGGGGFCPLQARREKRGVLSASGPMRKAGGTVRFRHDTKSGGGGGGVAAYMSERSEGTLYERGDCNPQTPPPPPVSRKYGAMHGAALRMLTIPFSLIIRPLFPSFLHHHCLQILYATNFLIENVFYLLV